MYSPDVFLAKKGALLYQQEKYSTAIETFSKAIEYNSKCAMAFNDRGVCYEELGEYSNAVVDYSAAIEIDPKMDEAYYNRGRCYHSLRQDTESLSDYSNAIKIDPKCPEYYESRGIVRMKLKATSDAILDFNKAIELNPGNFWNYYHRGKCKYSDTKLESAIEDLTFAIQLKPNHASSFAIRGRCLQVRGMTDGDMNKVLKAIDDYSRSFDLNSNLVASMYNRAYCMYMLKEYFKAYEDLMKVGFLKPSSYGRNNERYSDLMEWCIEGIEEQLEGVPLEEETLEI